MSNNQIINFPRVHHEKPRDLVRFLRTIPEIPQFSYQVTGDRVFVYDLLLEILKAAQGISLNPLSVESFSEVVVNLLPGAYVTPVEAVTKWGVIPKGFTVEQVNGGFCVSNTELKSLIPVTVSSVSDAQLMLAEILAGKKIPTEFDTEFLGESSASVKYLFTDGHAVNSSIYLFNGQVYQHFPVPPDHFIPDYTAINDFFSVVCTGEQTLQPETDALYDFYETLYRPGFPLCDRDNHRVMRERLASLQELPLLAENICDDHYRGQINRLLNELDLSLKCFPVQLDLIDSDKITIKNLRKIYPELDSMSDGDLFISHDFYQKDVYDLDEYLGGCPVRNENFLFHVIGLLCTTDDKFIGIDSRIRDAGMIVAYLISKGFSSENALLKGSQFLRITHDIKTSLNNCTQVFRYIDLLNSCGGVICSGSNITTFADYFSTGRKYGQNIFRLLQDHANRE